MVLSVSVRRWCSVLVSDDGTATISPCITCCKHPSMHTARFRPAFCTYCPSEPTVNYGMISGSRVMKTWALRSSLSMFHMHFTCGCQHVSSQTCVSVTTQHARVRDFFVTICLIHAPLSHCKILARAPLPTVTSSRSPRPVPTSSRSTDGRLMAH